MELLRNEIDLFIKHLKIGDLKDEKHLKKVSELIDNSGGECPLPLDVIPNRMGINLNSVNSIGWKSQENGELVSLTVKFSQSEPEPENGPPLNDNNSEKVDTSKKGTIEKELHELLDDLIYYENLIIKSKGDEEAFADAKTKFKNHFNL